jgi:peptidoglycan-associated lipoprotein
MVPTRYQIGHLTTSQIMEQIMNKVRAIVILAAILLASCAKDTPKEDLTTVPDGGSSLTADGGDKDLKDAALKAQKLETQRQDLEDLINRIMSEDVYFDYDKAQLTEKARELLAQVGDILIKETQFVVRVEGHTDARGTESYNLSLGGKRANAVEKYLSDYGVGADRINTVSYGEEKPKADGETEEAFSQNRRARFKVDIRK